MNFLKLVKYQAFQTFVRAKFTNFRTHLYNIRLPTKINETKIVQHTCTCTILNKVHLHTYNCTCTWHLNVHVNESCTCTSRCIQTCIHVHACTVYMYMHRMYSSHQIKFYIIEINMRRTIVCAAYNYRFAINNRIRSIIVVGTACNE